MVRRLLAKLKGDGSFIMGVGGIMSTLKKRYGGLLFSGFIHGDQFRPEVVVERINLLQITLRFPQVTFENDKTIVRCRFRSP